MKAALIYVGVRKGIISSYKVVIVGISFRQEGKEEVNRYYTFNSSMSYEQAKLKALFSFFTELDTGNTINTNKSFYDTTLIEIFIDNHVMTYDWEDVLSKRFENIKHVDDWINLRNKLIQFKIKPNIKNAGYLTRSWRSEIQDTIERGKFNEFVANC